MNGSNLNRHAATTPSYQTLAADKLLALLKRARHSRSAPKVVTGCASEISSCVQHDHAYADALKEYGALYEVAQAYLVPAQSEHDYASWTQEAPGASQAQLEMIALCESLQPQGGIDAPRISDDEVECCGYLGWLRH